MPTAAARRATAADRKRQQERQRQPKNKPLRESEIDEAVIADITPDALLASLLNHKYKFSKIKAEGRSQRKVVIVEEFSGIENPIFRVKRTTYSYYRTIDAAIESAKKECAHLQVF